MAATHAPFSKSQAIRLDHIDFYAGPPSKSSRGKDSPLVVAPLSQGSDQVQRLAIRDASLELVDGRNTSDNVHSLPNIADDYSATCAQHDQDDSSLEFLPDLAAVSSGYSSVMEVTNRTDEQIFQGDKYDAAVESIESIESVDGLETMPLDDMTPDHSLGRSPSTASTHPSSESSRNVSPSCRSLSEPSYIPVVGPLQLPTTVTTESLQDACKSKSSDVSEDRASVPSEDVAQSRTPELHDRDHQHIELAPVTRNSSRSSVDLPGREHRDDCGKVSGDSWSSDSDAPYIPAHKAAARRQQARIRKRGRGAKGRQFSPARSASRERTQIPATPSPSRSSVSDDRDNHSAHRALHAFLMRRREENEEVLTIRIPLASLLDYAEGFHEGSSALYPIERANFARAKATSRSTETTSRARYSVGEDKLLKLPERAIKPGTVLGPDCQALLQAIS